MSNREESKLTENDLLIKKQIQNRHKPVKFRLCICGHTKASHSVGNWKSQGKCLKCNCGGYNPV